MNETTKSKQYWGDIERAATQGRGIDIGCGPDPVTEEARRFDMEDGDANRVTDFVHEQFDFVYSSHCLEHMHDPRATIKDWWKLVKPGGYLFVMIPDEDLYEQGYFPSRFNPDHKATFTICKSNSWSPKSINVLDLANSLPDGQLVSLELQDRGYDRALIGTSPRSANRKVRLLIKLARWMSLEGEIGIQRLLATYYPLDQTHSRDAQAQIQLIVKKRS